MLASERWAALNVAALPSVCQDFYYMSHPHFTYLFDVRSTQRHAASDSQGQPMHGRGPYGLHADASDDGLDLALRMVALPDGLITRLNTLIQALPDESADQVNWLGC